MEEKYNMLENMFMTIIKMSATASIAAVMIILLRLIVGRKLPKTFYYAAWAIVLIRLLVPFSISTGFSVFNFIPSYSGEEHQQVNMHQYEIKTIGMQRQCRSKCTSPGYNL